LDEELQAKPNSKLEEIIGGLLDNLKQKEQFETYLLKLFCEIKKSNSENDC